MQLLTPDTARRCTFIVPLAVPALCVLAEGVYYFIKFDIIAAFNRLRIAERDK